MSVYVGCCSAIGFCPIRANGKCLFGCGGEPDCAKGGCRGIPDYSVGISFKRSTEKEIERLRQSLTLGFLLKVDTRNEVYFKTFDDGMGDRKGE